MRSLVVAVALLLSPFPADAGHTVTAAQWKDIRAMVNAMFQCEPEAEERHLREACQRWRRLETRLAKQGLMHHKRGGICKLAYHGPKEDRVMDTPWKDGQYCYELHDPAHR